MAATECSFVVWRFAAAGGEENLLVEGQEI